MLSIYVCDDIIEQADYFCTIINQYILFKDWDIQPAKSANTPELLFELISSDSNTALYFLDIELKASMDGFAVAKEIRRLDPRGFIVFLTTHGEKAPLAFKYRVEAMEYIVKDDNTNIEQRIECCVYDAYSRYQLFSIDDENHLVFKSNYRDIYVSRKEIICICTSSVPHQLFIITSQKSTSVYGSLKDYSSKLGPTFLRIHKSCIVNCEHIVEVNHRDLCVKMTDGSSFQISNRCKKNLAVVSELIK